MHGVGSGVLLQRAWLAARVAVPLLLGRGQCPLGSAVRAPFAATQHGTPVTLLPAAFGARAVLQRLADMPEVKLRFCSVSYVLRLKDCTEYGMDTSLPLSAITGIELCMPGKFL